MQIFTLKSSLAGIYIIYMLFLLLCVFRGGYINRLFTCTNKVATGNEPQTVVLRLYGGKLDLRGDAIMLNGGILEEVLVFNKLSDLGLGPKLFCVFEKGRLEEYLPVSLGVHFRDLVNETYNTGSFTQ